MFFASSPLLFALIAIASAQPAPPAVVGAVEVAKFTSSTGFIDGVVDSDGQRVAYLVADRANNTELHVYSYATKTEQVVDVSQVRRQLDLDQPRTLVLVGSRVFFTSTNSNGDEVGALIELDNRRTPAGAVVRALGPAANITVIKRGGQQRVAVHKTTPSKAGTRHDVALHALDTGERVAVARPLELDAQNTNARLDFVVNHWSEGFTRAHGAHAHRPYEGTYDLLSNSFTDEARIKDPAEQRARFKTIAEARQAAFVRLGDNATIELWARGQRNVVALDQPHDLESLHPIVLADGSAWLAVRTDAATKPGYLDVFRVTRDGQATRVARVPAQERDFGVIGDRFWLLERDARTLTIYAVQ